MVRQREKMNHFFDGKTDEERMEYFNSEAFEVYYGMLSQGGQIPWIQERHRVLNALAEKSIAFEEELEQLGCGVWTT